MMLTRGCGLDRVVAFSCKGRGFCPSCGGRRMADTAAHLVDRVLPEVPVRQWVLSLPFALRYRLAYDAPLVQTALDVHSRERGARDLQPRSRNLFPAWSRSGGGAGMLYCVRVSGGSFQVPSSASAFGQ
jgi:hypothetical protein